MKYREMVLAVVGSIALCAGCNDPKVATKSNLAEGLNTWLAKQMHCITFLDDQGNLQNMATPQADNTDFDLLVDHGLLKREAATSPSPSQPYYVYDLTSKGKSLKTTTTTRVGKHVDGYLCSGKPAVDQILSFTEPAEEGGVRQTRVTYTTKLVDVPSWAKDPVIARKFTQFEPRVSREDETSEEVMELTSEGWHARDDIR